MTADQIVSKMNSFLHISANVLSDWLSDLLPKTSNNWWDDCVLAKLSFNQAETARNRGFTELKQFDLAALLRIADRSWYELRTVAFLPVWVRECIRDMMRARNNWAHVGAVIPGKDAILADLDTLYRFFEQRGCEDSLLNEVRHMSEAVKSSSLSVYSVQAADSGGVVDNNAPKQAMLNQNEISEKCLVYPIGNPNEKGLVFRITEIGDTKKYDVFINGEIKTFYSGQIVLHVEKAKYKWLDMPEFQSYMTAYQINHPSGTDLYSLNAARIDFVPYQFRPALKMLHADEPRILIADSVGVGKTIEAGLIIKELEARRNLENIVIICPKPLVAERKWELEMKRFDEDFVPVDGPMLRQILSDTDRDGEWPARFSKVIIPYSVLDGRVLDGEKTRKHSYGLNQLDPSPRFDLVIVDEAHHIRNGSDDKQKAFAYKCVKYFCNHADAVVMLTATPLQTSNDDLFTLLNVLRPDLVIDKPTFYMMSRPNAHISRAAKAMRLADESWQDIALEELREVSETQWGENVIAANPVYGEIIKTLQKNAVTREERVKLISDTESLHSFNSMLNRTRRKDIQDFCVRRPYTLAVDFTPEQKALHDEVLKFEASALLRLHGDARSVSFMMSTVKRQAASCIFGLALYVRDIIKKRFDQLEDDSEFDFSGCPIDGFESDLLESLAQNLLSMADNLPDNDPKFDQMLGVILEKQRQENNKVIIFSTFKHTLYYLKKKLVSAGIRVAQVDGSVKDEMRQELRARFELPKNDKDAVDVMLFTEVGSEGLDYQFCNMMINYDLPWNPMKIEQRIGRIDRRGQQSETVSIYNMVTNDTVDADVYFRCLARIGIFENSIGECDEILGEIKSELDSIAFDTSLTEEERNRKLEQIADNEVRKIQELSRLEDEEKEFFGFDLSEYVTSQEIQKAENPWLSQKGIQILVDQYLKQRLGQGVYILGDSQSKQLRLSADARSKIRDDFLKFSTKRDSVSKAWDVYLKGNNPMHAITFDSETAEKKRDAFFITPMHPLARQAAAFFNSNETSYISIRYSSDVLPKGKYRFSVYAWRYVGIYPHFKLVTVCEDNNVASELPFILQESQICNNETAIQPSEWDVLENKHIELWANAKKDEIAAAKKTASFKLESLSNNYSNQRRSLEQRIMDTEDEKIKKMYTGQMETAKRRYDNAVAEIQQKLDQTDIHTTLIAHGSVEVED